MHRVREMAKKPFVAAGTHVRSAGSRIGSFFKTIFVRIPKKVFKALVLVAVFIAMGACIYIGVPVATAMLLRKYALFVSNELVIAYAGLVVGITVGYVYARRHLASAASSVVPVVAESTTVPDTAVPLRLQARVGIDLFKASCRKLLAQESIQVPEKMLDGIDALEIGMIEQRYDQALASLVVIERALLEVNKSLEDTSTEIWNHFNGARSALAEMIAQKAQVEPDPAAEASPGEAAKA